MASQAPVASGPPFPLDSRAGSPWREQALTQIGEQRFVLAWMASLPGVAPPSPEAVATINDHWEAAAAAAKRPSHRGASVERVTSNLDAVQTDLLRLGPAAYVRGQLPGLAVQVRRLLSADDPRRLHVEALAAQPARAPLAAPDRELVVAASHAVSAEARREITRLRSFQRILLMTAAVLFAAAAGLGVFATAFPDKVPMCFTPGADVVCATSTAHVQQVRPTPADVDHAMRRAASRWDVLVVEGVGLLAAAMAAAASLRRIRGSSTPFGLPIALALLKLPTGALTAVLGIVLMRGDFVPGLSALDSSGQILSWSVVFGYSQQLLTRSVDARAQTVLDDFGRRHDQRRAPQSPAPVPPVAPAHVPN